ncbi:LPD29 domain-containing protein [Flagellimonas sp. CMM7]|uniref:LPD29 domain-containing protein n=1 Tax=Flagellimonas sp. CMM7 TaxID=2654676 RepID=UPI0013D6EEE0|nr:LPD29 domain-containing protein [Flagellimonas sp. CMM7]UII80026.1 hypothetical protein LV704_00545 [Flagellimonas sp. CMM7]
MPYITTEQVKEKRILIKKALPEYKFSIRREHGTSIDISILEGPINLMDGSEHRSYVQVNQFYIKDHYADRPEIAKVLQTVYQIASSEQRELVYDGDYGSVPNYYVSINIGQWNRPFKQIQA